MITMISLLKRREDDTLEEFLAWYRTHAEAAAHIPGLRRYTTSYAVKDGQAWDAVSKLTFDDADALRAALDGPEGTRSRADTLAHVSAREVVLVTEEEIPVPRD